MYYYLMCFLGVQNVLECVGKCSVNSQIVNTQIGFVNHCFSFAATYLFML